MRAPLLLLTLFGFTATPVIAQPSPADVEYFEKKVRPILAERCFECHSTRARKQRGGLFLDSGEAIVKGGDSGPAVVPGRPDEALLVKAVRYGDLHLQMPPKGKLPDAEVASLVEWVRRGAVFPGVTTKQAVKASIDIEAGRAFWSFQPPRASSPPATKDPIWVQRPMDAFLLAEMEKRGLGPSAVASRRVLIRRASFDLIGLPPTPEEVEAFVADPATDAYARLVDRLLSSPHHGERWGRYWLDLVRYCDVAEPWFEGKGKPYVYRDWVVQVLNDGMPYDRFVQMQLAADLMTDARPADRAALGFLGLSPTYWKELKLDKDVIRTVVAEEWEERIAAISGTFLGLTVACARCHDHKFDPISQKDYYGLAGVLASIRQADRPLLPDAEAAVVQKAQARVQTLDNEIKKLQADKSADAKKLEALRQESETIRKATPRFDVPLAPGVDEASQYVLADGPHKTKLEYKPGVAQDVAMQIRGNPASPGPVVPRRFLTVLSPIPFTHGSGRLDLAHALVKEGTPLSSRVIVNRVWKHHFGTGLVETPSDFGVQGDRPSHPALLDDLAARFIANGWSLRWLHREIMLSAAYQQASAHDAVKHAIDPDNRLLWRMNRRRLDVEAWRDAMLAVTGTLDHTVGGPPLDLGAATNHRRTIYGTIKRRELHDLLRLYDFPDPTGHSPNRVPTTTPLQQLFTLNSPFMQQQAAALVRRLDADVGEDTERRIQRAYQILYGRPATAGQLHQALVFMGGNSDSSPPSNQIWEQYAHILLGSNESVFID